MSWNYRVIKKKGGFEGFYYEIHEVYYNPDDSIWAVSTDPIHAMGENPGELKGDLKLMMKAFNHPILTEEEIVFAQRFEEKGKDHEE